MDRIILLQHFACKLLNSTIIFVPYSDRTILNILSTPSGNDYGNRTRKEDYQLLYTHSWIIAFILLRSSYLMTYRLSLHYA